MFLHKLLMDCDKIVGGPEVNTKTVISQHESCVDRVLRQDHVAYFNLTSNQNICGTWKIIFCG